MSAKKTTPPKQHIKMTRLIDDLELKVLKTSASNVNVSSDDLLILVEYARQLEAVVSSDGDDPHNAKQLFLK